MFKVLWYEKSKPDCDNPSDITGGLNFELNGTPFIKDPGGRPLYIGGWVIYDMHGLLEGTEKILKGDKEFSVWGELDLFIVRRLDDKVETSSATTMTNLPGERAKVAVHDLLRGGPVERDVVIENRMVVELEEFVHGVIQSGMELVNHLLSKSPMLKKDLKELEEIILEITKVMKEKSYAL